MQRKIRPDPLIPDHEVLRKIGGGSYGEVWMARGVTGAMRAVKVVYREDFSDERTFEREFEGILRFEPISRNHQGFVNILHVGRSTGSFEFYYYVMELGDDAHQVEEINPVEYEPRTLRTDMKEANGSPLDTDFCIETGHRLAEALQELHECGLTHRDVKPSNIIFVDGRAKLADIGLVAAKDQRTFVGTEGFVPPEGPGSEGADVYGLGKVLYEMASGMDRLQFPELPEEGPGDDSRRKWIRLNRLVCDMCEPRIAKRKVRTAKELAEVLGRLKEGRSAPRRVPAWAKVMTVLFLLLGTFISQLWIEQTWGTYVIEGKREPLPPRFVMVKVLTNPQGASVSNDEGEILGYTPATLEGIEVGTVLDLHIKAPKYRELLIARKAEDEGNQVMIIEESLQRFAPPIDGQSWTDALGNRYEPEDGKRHRSDHYVSADDWRLFEKESGENARAITLNHEGREIVVVSREWAGKYARWLEAKCLADGFFREYQQSQPEQNRQLVPDFDLQFPEEKLPSDAKKRGETLRPFRMLVRPIPYATLTILSEPEGAYVYLNDIPMGVTPFGLDEEENVAPGDTEIELQLGGMKILTDNVFLADGEKVEKFYTLERNESFIPREPWTNSLKMPLEPLDDDLSAAVWETRSGDYRKYLKATRQEAGEVILSDNPDIPVTNVTREDCEGFCDWLTRFERDNPNTELNRITKAFRYRLPTDAEWSRLVGLIETGGSPSEREQENPDQFPWGESFPPPNYWANYADSERVEEFGADRVIPGYLDGYETVAPVGQLEPNFMGLYDLGGNLHEWVSDSYFDSSRGILRGGGWNSFSKGHLESRSRFVENDLSKREAHYGFRVVLARDPEKTPEEITESEDYGND